jgi:AcrR family transcriptional regulator
MARLVAERAEILPILAELFREHGYEGASLSLISERTGLGKGSLYHFFPGGKEEMAAAVLDEIDGWFEQQIFAPLRDADNPPEAIAAMLDAVDRYFRSGRRICLVGALALNDARDRFAERIRSYFARWRDALTQALERRGDTENEASARAEDVLAAIQGGLVLARALDDPGAYERILARCRIALAETDRG